MDAAQIDVRVREVVAAVCEGLEADRIHADHSLEANFGFDSFQRVELLNNLEDQFDITFPHPQDRELTTPTTTVRALIEAVQRLVSLKGSLA